LILRKKGYPKKKESMKKISLIVILIFVALNISVAYKNSGKVMED